MSIRIFSLPRQFGCAGASGVNVAEKPRLSFVGMPIIALIALAIFGGEAIRGFCLSMLFGVVIGTYSSIFVAAPILIYLGVRVGEGTASGSAKTAKAGA